MIILHHKQFPLIILYAIMLHVVWGICGILDAGAFTGTAISGVYAVFGGATSYVCWGVAAAALGGLFIRSSVYGFLAMMPQQCALILSAFAAIHAVDVSQFADGVARSRAFILADQLPAILAAVTHTMAMIHLALERK